MLTTFSVKKLIKLAFLLFFTFFSILDKSIAQVPLPGSVVSAMDSEVQKEETRLNYENTQANKNAQDAEIQKWEDFIKKRIDIVKDPDKRKELEKEISTAGIELSEVLDRQGELFQNQEIWDTWLTAAFPNTRMFYKSNQCNPDFWPQNFICSSCLAYIPFTGICSVFGLTFATHARLPTQLITISTDSQSTPYTSKDLKDISAKASRGEDIPGVSKQVNEVAATIDEKIKCVEKSLITAATQQMVAKSFGASVTGNIADETKQELQGCIKNVRINFDDPQKISNPVTGEYVDNSTNSIVAKSVNQRTFSYSLSPFTLARQMYKAAQDSGSAVYMNFRVYLSFFNGVTFEIVNDPSIPFYIKPPYDMALETNLEKVVGTAKPESDLFASVSDTIGNDALSPAYLHKDNKIEISEYKASPKAPEDDLSEFSKFSITDVRDGDLFIPYTDKLRKNSFSLKILNKYPELAYANDPNLAVEHKKIIDERRTTRCSDFFGKKITEAKLNSGVLSSGISKQLAKQATEIAANNSFGLIGQMAIGSLIAKGQESLEKTFEQNIQDNIDENPNYCSTITGAGYGYKSGVTVGRDDMAPLSKIFGHELPFILRSEVGGYNLAIPPSAGESNGIASGLFSIVGRNSGSQDYTMQFVSTNPRFYEMDENRKSFGDRIQYLGMDLRKLEYPNQPSINWNYDNDCRKFQITSSQSPDEAKVFPGNEAKIYVVNSAFIRCPAFSPMNEFSIPGWPKSLTKEFFEVMFDMLSALGIDVGVEPFDERYY